jgi:hypothetical protein
MTKFNFRSIKMYFIDNSDKTKLKYIEFELEYQKITKKVYKRLIQNVENGFVYLLLNQVIIDIYYDTGLFKERPILEELMEVTK